MALVHSRNIHVVTNFGSLACMHLGVVSEAMNKRGWREADELHVLMLQTMSLYVRCIDHYQDEDDASLRIGVGGSGASQTPHFHLIGFVPYFQATDPKDKAYASMWTVSRMPNADLGDQFYQVDYEKNLETIYTEFTRALIRADEDRGAIYRTLQRGRYSRLPSWVPDWNAHVNARETHYQQMWIADDVHEGWGAREALLQF